MDLENFSRPTKNTPQHFSFQAETEVRKLKKEVERLKEELKIHQIHKTTIIKKNEKLALTIAKLEAQILKLTTKQSNPIERIPLNLDVVKESRAQARIAGKQEALEEIKSLRIKLGQKELTEKVEYLTKQVAHLKEQNTKIKKETSDEIQKLKLEKVELEIQKIKPYKSRANFPGTPEVQIQKMKKYLRHHKGM